MLTKVISINFLLFFISGYSCIEGSTNMTLELIQVIFRHGARTPSQNEASHINVTDPNIYGPQGFYQLTNVNDTSVVAIKFKSLQTGKRQAYKLGCKLREKYDTFLSTYKSNQIYALSTGHTRTKMSLQLVLAGLYPLSTEDTWNSNLSWTPIPFHQNSADSDVLLAPHQSSKFEELRRSTIASSEEYQKIISNYSDFLGFMKKNTGFNYEENILYQCGWTYYVIKIHKMLHLQLPSWCTDDVYKKIEELFIIGLDSMSWTQQLKKLNGGTLVRKVIENIEENKKINEPKKLFLYSTHDLTLAGFTRAQNTETFKIPHFANAIIVEKYSDSQSKEYIKMVSWDGESETFENLTIGSCGISCPLKDYIEMVKEVIPTDEDLDFLSSD